MAVLIPEYIRERNIQDPVIRYKWDDWDMRPAELPIDDEFYSRLQGISQRANIAFSLGTAEWIVYRLGGLCDDWLPRQYLEAAWAQIVHWRYRALNWDGDTDPNDWTGPARMPVWRAMALTEFSIYEAEQDGNPARGAVLVTSLARHIMTDTEPYESWRELIMNRLELLYPLDPNETLGEVVPPQALDPGFPFQLEQTESLINAFVSNLDYKTNPYLNAPQMMLQQGFEGIPYVFDIEKDRKDRYEW